MSAPATPRRLIVSATLLVIGVMLAISLTGFNRIRLLASDLEYVIQQQESQTALMYAIRKAAQERSLTLQSMLIVQNPFDLDELAIRMGQTAAEYQTARQQLLGMSLGDEERALLERQHRQTTVTATLQARILDLLREEQTQIAAQLLLKAALPSQRQAMMMMDDFIELKRQQNLMTLHTTSRAIEHTYLLMLLLGLLSVALGGAIALHISRRIATEIEQRRQSEQELRKRELFERTIRDNIADGVLSLTVEGKILSCNRACAALFGYSKKELLGSLATMLIPSFNPHKSTASLIDRLTTLQQTGRRCFGRRKNGEQFPAELTISRITLDDEEICIALIRDISDKVRAEQRQLEFQHELELRVEERTDELLMANKLLRHEIEERLSMQQELVHMATHDTLTQLPNRARFAEQLQQTTLHASRHQRLFALLFLDLDGFKALNDTHGHGVGDQALIEVATRLSRSVRDEDMIARIGGDEFTVLLGKISKAEDASMVAQKLIDEINRPIIIDNHICRLGTSIGISVYPFNADDPDTLLSLADDAMYAAKESGKNTWCFSAACALNNAARHAS